MIKRSAIFKLISPGVVELLALFYEIDPKIPTRTVLLDITSFRTLDMVMIWKAAKKKEKIV